MHDARNGFLANKGACCNSVVIQLFIVSEFPRDNISLALEIELMFNL